MKTIAQWLRAAYVKARDVVVNIVGPWRPK